MFSHVLSEGFHLFVCLGQFLIEGQFKLSFTLGQRKEAVYPVSEPSLLLFAQIQKRQNLLKETVQTRHHLSLFLPKALKNLPVLKNEKAISLLYTNFQNKKYIKLIQNALV